MMGYPLDRHLDDNQSPYADIYIYPGFSAGFVLADWHLRMEAVLQGDPDPLLQTFDLWAAVYIVEHQDKRKLSVFLCDKYGKPFYGHNVGNASAAEAVWSLPLCDEQGNRAAFLMWAGEMWAPEEIRKAVRHFISLFELTLLKAKAADNELQKRKLERKLEQKTHLIQIVHRLFSLNKVDLIIKETFTLLHECFPGALIDLLLSQDHNCEDLPIKPTHMMAEDDFLCSTAFMKGWLVSFPADSGPYLEIAAPLSGNQGVYGVVHVRAGARVFTDDDLTFIGHLAAAAGTAFENMRLYEQSNLLVTELSLINEITRRLNQSLTPGDIYQFASDELLQTFQAEFCTILQINKEIGELVVQASNLKAICGDTLELDYGFAGLVFGSSEPLILSDYRKSRSVRSKMMEMTGSRSLIAAPILINGDVEGVILISHRRPGFFTYDNYRLLQVLSDHIGLAVSNASLHAEVRRMVITDNLTGLFTRSHLNEQVHLLQKKDPFGSLIVVDIDDFKLVNDTYGHLVGDRILVQVSTIIKSCIRETDIAARWGGEELAIYLPMVDIEQATRISERIRSRVLHETDPQVTVSCGISCWHGSDEKISPDVLFYKSDMALYRAKNSGKNQIKIG